MLLFDSVCLFIVFLNLAVIWRIRDEYCHGNDVASRWGGGGWLSSCHALSLWAYFHII